MDQNKEFSEINRSRWNKLAEQHFQIDYYGLEAFRRGKSSLLPIEMGEIPDIAGKKVLHLQCHFGMDTLSLARMGAEATGMDYSEKAIELANQLKEEVGVDATFVCCDIYDLPEVLADQKESFDFVFTSHGILVWLSDLAAWGNLITYFLKPGGQFYIIDGHPFSHVFDNEEYVTNFNVITSYFNKKVLKYDVAGSYVDIPLDSDNEEQEVMVSYEWDHTLSEIVMALINAGLTIEVLHEHSETSWRAYPFMKEKKNGMWEFGDDKPSIPVLFSILATKRQGAPISTN